MTKKGLSKKDRESLINSFSTPEYKEKNRIENQKKFERLSLDYQLGYYIGLYILMNRMPSLPINIFAYKNSHVKISIDEKLEYEKLEQEYEKSEEDEKKLEALNNYELILEKKYLPNPYVCKLDLIKFENEIEFRRGLSVGLYNQEVQYYNIEEIEITNNFDSPNTILTFKAFWSID